MKRSSAARVDWQSSVGLAGLLVWMFMFGVVEYAHDAILRKGSAQETWETVYEVAGGYVLGFVAALAVWILWNLVQGPMPELLAESTAGRILVGAAVLAVLVSALAGLVHHNFGGLTYTYDAAFAAGAAVVYYGVLPLYGRVRSKRS